MRRHILPVMLVKMLCIVLLGWPGARNAEAIIVPVDPPYLHFSSVIIDDDILGDSNGNGNGVANPGETLELYVGLINTGDTGATGIMASISTTSSYVTWLDNTSSTYPDIGMWGGTGTNLDDFDFQLSALAPAGTAITFTLQITAANGGPWSDSFTILAGDTSAIPEPATLLLLGLGIAGFVGHRGASRKR